ncbi:MAG: hypothetical protein TEF_08445 [Rhizobiales bacterium NRL2]|jgi:hypothetical protein|nr:MAG: hypothetical protein TEF_08445 [Rhizobiales bacterium NRL2]
MEHLWPGSPLVFLLAWFGWRIAAKAGYSGFWGLTALFPPLGLLMLWILAASKDWPKAAKPGGRGEGARTRDGGITIRRPGSEIKER